MKARRRSLGNIRFIGELYKLKMLTARIMHECLRKLIATTDEESLECLCRLLTTVGKDLEAETDERLRVITKEEAKNMVSWIGVSE
jgi:translation initiation factor 4G